MATPKAAKVISRSVSSTTKRRKSKEEFKREGGKKTTTRKLGTYEALWDCASCGAKGISGLEKSCPQCDSPKEDRHNEVYYTDKSKGKKLSQEEMDMAGISADHSSDLDCRYCGATLKPTTQECPICGGKVKDEPKAIVDQKPAKAKSSKTPLLVIGIIIAVFIGSSLLIGSIFGNKSPEATVASVSWKRTVVEEGYQYVEQQGWDLPSEADYLSEERKQSGTEKVVVGYKDEEKCTTDSVLDGYEESCTIEDITYDDGTTDSIENCTNEPLYRDEEDCTTEEVAIYEEQPVYGTWYTYDIWDWVVVDSVVETGTDYYASWPTINVSDENREGERTEEYTVIFEDKDGTNYTYTTFDYDEFKRYGDGGSWKLEIDDKKELVVDKPIRI